MVLWAKSRYPVSSLGFRQAFLSGNARTYSQNHHAKIQKLKSKDFDRREGLQSGRLFEMSITSGRALETDIICLLTPVVQNLMMFELDGVNEGISGRFHSGERCAFINIWFLD